MGEKTKGNMETPAKPNAYFAYPAGELGTGIEFTHEPEEKISGHNVYEQPEKGRYGGTQEVESPAKVVKRVAVEE